MSKINWSRVIIGGLVAAVILFITDGLLHERVLGADWRAVYSNLPAPEPTHSGAGIAYFAVFELGRGLLSIFVYALMRSYFGAGPKTAAFAGVEVGSHSQLRARRSSFRSASIRMLFGSKWQRSNS